MQSRVGQKLWAGSVHIHGYRLTRGHNKLHHEGDRLRYINGWLKQVQHSCTAAAQITQKLIQGFNSEAASLKFVRT